MLSKAVGKIIIAAALLFSVNSYAEDEVYAIPDELHAVFKENGFKDVELEESMIRGSSLVIIFSDFDLKHDRYLNAIRLVCSEVKKKNDLLKDYDIDEDIDQNIMLLVQATFKYASNNYLLMLLCDTINCIDDHTITARIK